MFAKFTVGAVPGGQVPTGSGASTWFESEVGPPIVRTIAVTVKQPVGLPRASSGIAHSMPVVTPAPEDAAQPSETPATLWLSIVTWMPSGLVPPVSVPEPATPEPRGVNAPPVVFGSAA